MLRLSPSHTIKHMVPYLEVHTVFTKIYNTGVGIVNPSQQKIGSVSKYVQLLKTQPKNRLLQRVRST